MKLGRCLGCTSFVPSGLAGCPNCGAPPLEPRALGTRFGALAATAVGGLLSVTLSACYGICDDPDGDGMCNPETSCVDMDRDGYCFAVDCDDDNRDINNPDPDGDGVLLPGCAERPGDPPMSTFPGDAGPRR